MDNTKNDPKAGLSACLNTLQNSGTSLEARRDLALEICDHSNADVFGLTEAEVVAEILFILSYDIEKKIRQIVSRNLKDNPNLPKRVALKLATDIVEVSLPVLESSPVFSDEDLLQIIRSTQETAKLEAISKRKLLPERVVDELMNSRNIEIIKTVIQNRKAEISERSMMRIINDFKHNEAILGDLVDRSNLPTQTVEHMLTLVSDKLKERILVEYNVSLGTESLMVEEAKDEKLLESVKRKSRNEIDDFVNIMYRERKLTTGLIIRALCKGNLAFFESSLAYLTGAPLPNVRKLVYDGSAKGFAALYKAAKLPDVFYEAAHIILQFTLEEQNKGKSGKDYSKAIHDRIIAGGYDQSIANMQQLLKIISNGRVISHENPTAH